MLSSSPSLGEVLFGAVETSGSTSENKSMLPGRGPAAEAEVDSDNGSCKVEARPNNG